MRNRLAVLAAALFRTLAHAGSPSKADFNDRSNILIAGQFNNRVVEVDPDGNLLWQFGRGPNDFSAMSIIGCNDAQRVGPFTLMAGTGTPPNTVPNGTNTNGCPDNRVVLVNRQGHIVWQHGTFSVVNTPVQNTWLPNHHALITDQATQRVIEVDHDKNIVWQYAMTGIPFQQGRFA
jgi:hypothetical protein